MDKCTTKTGKKYRHLCFAEREELSVGLGAKESIREIARKIGRHPSSIYREIKRNSPPKNNVHYRANRAQLRAEARCKESHTRIRLANAKVRPYVEQKLAESWTPELIAGRLPMENPGLLTNYESIYQWMYSERKDLIQYLPRANRKRKKRCSTKNKRCVRVQNRTMIEQRPPAVQDRTEKGHWEADTMTSRQSKAAVSGVVERKSRFLIVKKISQKTASCMDAAVVKSLKKYPEELRKTITYDNGLENARHEATNKSLHTKSYFCNPYHSWEKGSIENRFGVIRRFFPKKTDWALITQSEIDKLVNLINSRPMKCLGFKTPKEVFVALRH